MREIKLRNWQTQAIEKCINWLTIVKESKHFVINAAPGSGKTICASVIASKLIQSGEIERVIVIAPRSEVVRQWGQEFEFVTARHMSKVTGADDDIGNSDYDLCATWQAIENLSDGLREVCNKSKTLVICDEHHHAAVSAAWGKGADSAFRNSKYVLVLTGTPIRSDGEETVWMAYDSKGKIDQPSEGMFTLTYGEAVDLGYCRPAVFHRHEGNFKVEIDNNTTIEISGSKKPKIPENIKKLKGLSQALDFYQLARSPSYLSDNITPDTDSFQGTMLQWGINKLNDLRKTMPSAGGLVIAPNIEMAKYMAEILEMLDGEKPTLVHSGLTNVENKIAAFRATNKKWIVSVAMISEGVDIKRLRVLVYLPNARTELAFRQSLGRVVRSMGPDDMSRAYVIMPKLNLLEQHAKSVEREMSPAALKGEYKPKTKICPSCESKCPITAKECDACGYEFLEENSNQFECDECGAINLVGSTECHNCGTKFKAEFKITLKEALRMGAIIRGGEIDEEEVRLGEKIGRDTINDILGSGDERLIKIINGLPEESMGRLAKIINKHSFN